MMNMKKQTANGNLRTANSKQQTGKSHSSFYHGQPLTEIVQPYYKLQSAIREKPVDEKQSTANSKQQTGKHPFCVTPAKSVLLARKQGSGTMRGNSQSVIWKKYLSFVICNLKFVAVAVLLLSAVLTPMAVAEARTEPAAPARVILSWINEQMTAIDRLNAELIASGQAIEGSNCKAGIGWAIGSTARFRLGIDDFQRSVVNIGQNKCLTNDVNRIESRIQRIVRETAESELSCDTNKVQWVNGVINQIYFLKSSLEYYSDLTEEDEDRARENDMHPSQEFKRKFGFAPPFLNENFSFIAPEYTSDAVCPDPQSFFSFHQVLQQWQALLYRIEQIMEMGKNFGEAATSFSSGSSSLFSDEDLERMRRKGSADGEAWFRRNIVQPIDDVFFLEYEEEGTPLIAKDESEVPETVELMYKRGVFGQGRTLEEIKEDYGLETNSVNSINSLDAGTRNYPNARTSGIDEPLTNRKVYEIPQREREYIEDAEIFFHNAMLMLKIPTEVSPAVAESIEEPLIEPPRKIDTSRKEQEAANRLLEGVCRSHGACS